MPNVSTPRNAPEPEPRKRQNAKPHKMGDMNLTSMLDVVFQLLIFFVLTSSFAVGEGILPAELPIGQGEYRDTDPPPQPLNIKLKSAGGDDVQIQIDGLPDAPANFNELYTMLRAMRADSGGPYAIYNPRTDPIVIQPDATVGWGHVTNAFNACVRAEYENVNFATPER